MRKIQVGFVVILTSLFYSIPVVSQIDPAPSISSFNDMQSVYTGNVSYDAGTKTVTFESDGTMAFAGRTEQTDNIWHIPKEITKVIIKPA
ncbi:MAG: hypothetical protein MI922_22920 [Bacteroidales bacterium]|nr:hypothetical protein [Bacteroidales bacterium]